MAGKGRPPKDPSELARKDKPRKPFVEIDVDFSSQPLLEDLLGTFNPLTGDAWSRATLLLWSQLADFPTTANLLPAQWSSFARAFMLDDALIAGDKKMAVEARMRMSKYGIDPDDLMRMRIKVTSSEPAVASAKALGGARKTRLLKVVGSIDGKESTAV